MILFSFLSWSLKYIIIRINARLIGISIRLCRLRNRGCVRACVRMYDSLELLRYLVDQNLLPPSWQFFMTESVVSSAQPSEKHCHVITFTRHSNLSKDQSDAITPSNTDLNHAYIMHLFRHLQKQYLYSFELKTHTYTEKLLRL